MCTSFQAKYKVLHKIGEGSFSEVLKCQDRITGIIYAAKRLKKIYQNVNEVMESAEVTAMRKINHHPNVLYMVESHYDPLPGRVTLIFELMDMSLYDLMNNRKGHLLLEIYVKNYIYQMLKGLEHLHKHGIFHRDIKPENILLKAGLVKIGDLGSIRGIYSKPPYTEYISTRWYRSPECLLTSGFYGPKMDVWATGCVFFELLALEPLFPGENEVDQVSKIHNVLGTPHARLIAKFRRIRTRNGDFYFPSKQGRGLACLLPQLSSIGLEILRMMLVYDPENRATAKKLLEHRYFADIREKEFARQTRSALLSSNLSSNLSSDSEHWKDPLALGYLSSRRHCRLRLMNGCQSQANCAETTKVPKNNVSPSCKVSSTSLARTVHRSSESKIPQFSGLESLRNTQIGKYFLRKRQNVEKKRSSDSQSKKWHDPDSSFKFSNRDDRCDKTAQFSSVRQRSTYDHGLFSNEKQNSQKEHRDNDTTKSSELPSIYVKRNKNMVYHSNSSFVLLNNDSYKMSLKNEDRPTGGLLTRKTSTTVRSPMSKIVKREPNDYYFRSTSFDSSKFVLRKCYGQKFKYRPN